MATPQQLADGLCLRFSGDIPPQPALTVEMAVNLLIRGTHASSQLPYVWGYVDRPSDGAVYLIFIGSQLSFPNDGMRFQENEQRFAIPAGNGREVEMIEAKFGFIPGSGENIANRVRRKFRMTKGGNPQLALVHYSRGQAVPMNPALNQPTRSYPLQPVNLPAVYIAGDKVGQKVLQGTAGGPPGVPPPMGMGYPVPATTQSMLAQQNRQMEALERRNAEQRARGSMNAVCPLLGTVVVLADTCVLEKEMISTRTLALTRFQRNHEFMDEVFMQAALGDKHPPKRKSPWSIFDAADLESKTTKLTAEIAELQKRTEERRAQRSALASGDADVSMTSISI
ncbi:hypothetical protein BJ322DRAFT_1008233 [Thelephora terrestris]|uniref:SWI/SNF and RSC complexes subunit Ssr4 N-terminal domain-containing protein n=1 Tax=Thelephora terrestris TaxID=56493 RepID=A0A9P6L5L0_9AGAM|nr:hypothetical protein BJ322DRAFT_1008233 [Thelephora terrestris]